MNEFVEQFLIESRDLVDHATADLLHLEQHPGDTAAIDSVFRGFHTLKGAAGIVDFAAMARAVHAVEDVLAEVRSGERAVTTPLVGDCLLALDQVVRWLDLMAQTGEPPTNTDAAADAIVARFKPETAARPDLTGAPKALVEVLAGLLAAHSAEASRARTAIRYTPDSQCYFAGEDPLSIVAALPDLLVLELSVRQAGGARALFDPFACNLVLTALTQAGPADAGAVFARASGSVEILPMTRAVAALSGLPRDILEAQLALLAEHGQDGTAGHVASAGRTVANVLRHLHRAADAARLDQAAAQAQASNDGAELRRLIEDLLAEDGAGLGAGATESPVAVPDETASRALRVDVERVDALVRLTGELLIAKNAIAHLAGLAQSGLAPARLASDLKDQHALLDRLVSELQRAVLSIRVLPLRQVFQRFPRMVREMGVGLGRPVRLVTEGDDTEADKAIVDNLFEPLLHILRNAADHGVEAPDERLAKGKSATATIRLRAGRQGEHVFVEVEDDGRGVDLDRVRQIALTRGVANPQGLAAMDDAALVELIFAPGFSTASAVTDVSGRGVGMDAVRTAVARLGGRVSVETASGRGTRVRLLLPFTLMMTAIMTVEVAGQVFGIPLDEIVETIRVPRARIVGVGATHAFGLRDRTIPLIDLAVSLGLLAPETRANDATIVVVQIAGGLAGLEVDHIADRMDVMLQPKEGLLSGAAAVAGTTLLGDGRVLIVLDLEALLQ
jgi:two-component system, chemotaxis family, sensor kinase CheA